MYKMSVCKKCKGSFVITNNIEKSENVNLCDRCRIQLQNKILIENPNKEKECRNIAILSCRTVKKYIELVGLDIFEGKVVKLVDENGKKFGLHTYNEKIAMLKYKDIISVPVKFIDDHKCMNMFRICGDFKKLDSTDFYKLRFKYKMIYNHDICCNFKDILNIGGYDEFYCIVHFSKTEIKEHKNKLQIAFTANDKKYFVDCLDNRGKIGDVFKGMFLLRARKIKDSNSYKISMIKNMAKTINPDQENKNTENILRLDLETLSDVELELLNSLPL